MFWRMSIVLFFLQWKTGMEAVKLQKKLRIIKIDYNATVIQDLCETDQNVLVIHKSYFLQ